MGFNIRTMTAEDKPAIIRILRDSPEFKPAEVVVAEEVIDSYLDDPLYSGYNILVAKIGSIVAGYLCYGPTPLTESTWDIYWMAVTPDRQGKGIGSSLLELAEKNIIKTKGRLVIIETSSTPLYQKTRNFYVSRGYKQVACITDFYAPGDDKIIFEKRL